MTGAQHAARNLAANSRRTARGNAPKTKAIRDNPPEYHSVDSQWLCELGKAADVCSANKPAVPTLHP